MNTSHVINALIEKRGEIAGLILDLERQVRHAPRRTSALGRHA
jgi:hypothetical protein